MKAFWTVATALSLCPVAPSHAQTADEPRSTAPELDAELVQMLPAGVQVLTQKRPEEAITHYFDKVIATYAERYRGRPEAVYSAHDSTETVFYLRQHAARNSHQTAVVVGPTWAEAYFARAFALVELNQSDQARESLDRAIALSPGNSRYLSELAQMFMRGKDWQAALATLRQSEAAARSFSPADLKKHELGRALRGVGYVYVELGRLDEAAAIYQQCRSWTPPTGWLKPNSRM